MNAHTLFGTRSESANPAQQRGDLALPTPFDLSAGLLRSEKVSPTGYANPSASVGMVAATGNLAL
jgi:hypothetical protein